MVSLTTGFLCAALAVVFFGSNFVPVKTVETGDGMFFSWVMCAGVFCVGVIANAANGFPAFDPWAMLGGAIWCTGNMMCVPIIKLIGIGLGMLLWGTSNMLVGWATGRFGLFGVTPQLPCDDSHAVPATCIHDVALNYIGIALACMSLVMYMLVEPEDMDSASGESGKTETDRLIDHVRNDDYMSFMQTPRIISNKSFVEVSQVPSFHESLNELGDEETQTVQVKTSAAGRLDRLPKAQKRTLGVCMAIFAGIFFGTNLTPPQVEHDHGGDPDLIHYVFSHFCGIYFVMTVYFICYCGWHGKEAAIYPRAIVPGFFSGVMWGVAQLCWFVANSSGMGFAISFPIISCGPGLVASLWGVFVFREIKGTKNFIVISMAAILTISSGIVIGLSK